MGYVARRRNLSGEPKANRINYAAEPYNPSRYPVTNLLLYLSYCYIAFAKIHINLIVFQNCN